MMTAPIRTAGVPVGSIQVHPKALQSLRLLLEQKLGQKIRFRGVERQDDGRLLVHVPPIVAAILEREQLDGATYEYFPGVQQTLSLPPRIIQNDNSVFTFVELFAGIGGFRLGLEKIGGKCVLASELDPKATKIYKSHFTNVNTLVEGDVLDLDLRNFPPYTMLTAGFPCQPFSNRGHQRGFEDDRGQLYLELARILTETQPPCFLFENVSRLVFMDGGSRGKRIQGQVGTFTKGRVLSQVLGSFAACGYQVDWKIVNSRHFVPQNRERVYIVGTRNDLQCQKFDWNKVIPNEPCTATVRDILEPKDSPAVLESELTTQQWNKVQSLRDDDDLFLLLNKKAPTLISQYHRVGSLSSKFVSTKKGARFLTPRECCRIMGFPKDFPCDAPHFYSGIGNAVTPPVIAAIGRELIDCVLNAKR